MNIARPQRKRVMQEYLENRYGERNDAGFRRCRWRKTEDAAQERTVWRQVVCDLQEVSTMPRDNWSVACTALEKGTSQVRQG